MRGRSTLGMRDKSIAVNEPNPRGKASLRRTVGCEMFDVIYTRGTCLFLVFL